MAEFLPLCDVLFNVISLAGYFCDVVFDVVMGYALLHRGYTGCFGAVIALVGFSLLVSQIVSLRWYLHNNRSIKNSDGTKIKKSFTLYAVIAIHCCQLGVLWRYAKLFVPVDLRYVKHEVRDLCMLRLVHAFCQAAPMLLLQLYILTDSKNNPPPQTFSDLNVVASLLSLFSVCWALASFSKNVRLQNVHRLVLTWLGVIFQFLWRIGTVCSRVTALTIYTSLYTHWIFLVIGLHWMSMFLWLISPKNVFHGERISRPRKAVLGAMIAFVYVFAYVNLQEVNHRQKMVTFYVVMFSENCLLVAVWLVGVWPDRPPEWPLVPALVVATFAAGVLFMLIYYRYFHVRRLGYEAGGRLPVSNNNQCTEPECSNGCKCTPVATSSMGPSSENHASDNNKYQTHAIPGVFNCRFTNPVSSYASSGATKRKKKKPTSFVPPPTLNSLANPIGPAPVPFWRKPLPSSHHHQGGSSENEGSSVGSRVNIHQKLQEKKQKQLAELKIIEEEIKQGKLGGPTCNSIISGDESLSSLPRQPIPVSKKHIDIEPVIWAPPSPELGKSFENLGNLGHHLGLGGFLGQGLNYDGLNQNLNYNGLNFTQNLNSFDMNKQNGYHPDPGNMSPISQISATESNSLTRQVLPRSKIHFLPRQLVVLYPENLSGYPNDNRGHSGYPDSNRINYNENNHRQMSGFLENQKSISPRNVLNHSPRLAYEQPSRGNDKNMFENRTQYSENSLKNNQVPYDRGIYNDNKNRIYNSGNINPVNGYVNQNHNIPFPYHIVPPPKSKLDRTAVERTKIQRAKTPEILLAPHYLDNSRVYCEWNSREPVYRMQNDDKLPPLQHISTSSVDENHHNPIDSTMDSPGHSNQDGFKNNTHSDIDSQVSLPRSYTLPREFKYYRRNRGRKVIRNEHFVASTNSSDGDVDSGDDNESERHSNHSQQHVKAVNTQINHNPNVPVAKHQHSISQPSYNHIGNEYNHSQSSTVNSTNHQIPHHQHSLSQPSYSHITEQKYDNNVNVNYLETTRKNSSDLSNTSGQVPLKNTNVQSPNHKSALSTTCTPQKILSLAVAKNTNVPTKVSNTAGSTNNEGLGVSPAHGRQIRSRLYGVTKGVRHETKL